MLLAYLFNKYHSVISCYSFFTKQRITTASSAYLHLLDFTQQPTVHEGGVRGAAAVGGSRISWTDFRLMNCVNDMHEAGNQEAPFHEINKSRQM